jgi:hypothetical protein
LVCNIIEIGVQQETDEADPRKEVKLVKAPKRED